ncbi:MAG: exodeoxyribonuclease VII large subunit [Candidatus Symbiothrix sp.]|jgi:exodeoxyribonuclease VII large subunit|nr:exodeoxyribonuclease VII large subunit [Candidatus Symbiothrix sp.]
MEYITLSQLNDYVAQALKKSFPATYWVMAEMSDVRYNANGHCYLEFIEKKDNAIIAKARGYIWATTFRTLKPYFEAQTGQSFVSGLKVLVRVSVDFHAQYGYGLSVCEIDPTYTMGDMQQRRQQILNQLKQEGILTLNQELPMPTLPQRIAVITSHTAAGYEDFMNHLQHNQHGFVFYPVIFSAVMQGEQTEQSVIDALNRIYTHIEAFDVVVIIRGGGATSDLASFDSYNLAANCAQFPLPVITGIGHERDDTVLDFISNYRAKTPTAVADYLVHRLEDAYTQLIDGQETIIAGAEAMLSTAHEFIKRLEHYLPLSAQTCIDKNRLTLEAFKANLQIYSHSYIDRKSMLLDALKGSLQQASKQFLFQAETLRKEKEAFFKLSSPDYILSQGYSITRRNGKAVRSATTLKSGDILETQLLDGTINSTI